jgi:hypothetical protein
MLNPILSSEAKTKTQQVDGFGTVVSCGHKCCRGMSWESPYIRIRMDSGLEILWHSDSVDWEMHHRGLQHGRSLVGKDVGVSALVRNDRVWRMKHLYLIPV